MLKKILITLSCLLAYFFFAFLLVGLILFIGGGIYAVWSLFWNIIS